MTIGELLRIRPGTVIMYSNIHGVVESYSIILDVEFDKEVVILIHENHSVKDYNLGHLQGEHWKIAAKLPPSACLKFVTVKNQFEKAHRMLQCFELERRRGIYVEDSEV